MFIDIIIIMLLKLCKCSANKLPQNTVIHTCICGTTINRQKYNIIFISTTTTTQSSVYIKLESE